MEIDQDKLVCEAIDARKKAYAPFSNFSVGAALLGYSGKIYTGCNVENRSYGLTICAERVAVFKTISEGEKEFKAIAVVADTDKPVSLCGACRQVLMEFSPEMVVIMANIHGDKNIQTLKDLLPDPF